MGGTVFALLQQYLPLAVLKLRYRHCEGSVLFYTLQQYLPLAVLKQTMAFWIEEPQPQVATVLTACGIETS